MARVLGQQTFVAEVTSANGDGDVPLIIEGAAGQTASLFQVKNSSGTTLFDVDAAGDLAGAQNFTGAATFASTLDVTGTTTLAAVSATSITATGNIAATGDITVTGGENIILSASTGTKIGTATTQLLGFYNATPVDQPSAYTQTFATADKTHAARTGTSVATTAVTQTSPYGYAGAAQGDAVATTINAIIVDLADTAGVVNALVDDLQELGLVG